MPDREDRPWLRSYGPGQPADLEPEFASALDMFRASAARVPESPAVRYFDGVLTFAGLDEASDALAAGLLDRGLSRGDRVALYLQNVPQFVVALLGAWKAGATAVPVNPMNKHQELDLLLRDSGAAVLVCLEGLYDAVARDVVPGTGVRLVLTTSELEHQRRDDARLFAGVSRLDCGGAVDLTGFIDAHRGRRPPPVSPGPDDVAFLTYTSGTTGPPKGAMNTHGNVVASSQAYREWCRLGPQDVVLGLAPLFHITGLVGHVTLALLLGVPLVLFHRFEPAVAVDAVREHRPTFTVGAITAFIALMNAPGADREALATLAKIWSGGAPIPPSTVAAFEERFGHYIHNIYGLTETTSPSHGVPHGAEAPVDAGSGALSIGVPMYGTVAYVVGDDGAALPSGETGEIVIRGPQVVPGYWNRPDETAHAIPGGALHTGDVGYVDDAGWFYIVDRKKDQINAGGYKVWPREVEDVLYEHGAVREAAVVGVPDAYRGETVKAFVSLRADQHTTPDELVDFCRARMAAYKYPRAVEVLDELPKTVSGKLLRRELRSRERSRAPATAQRPRDGHDSPSDPCGR
jgi:long-chain acyl-CoA synthetase